jgi:16S rRNA (guanine527-N7)-methyltransferase
MPTQVERFRRTLREQANEFGVELGDGEINDLTDYYQLLQKWNPSLHLVAPCAPEEFATRHILESLTLLPHLARGATVIDVGSGGGLPAVPCLILRSDLRAILIESSQKKVVFLREAVRQIAERPRLIAARFEDIEPLPGGFVTCRALDRFQQLLPRLIEWAPAECTLLLFAGPALREKIEGLLPSVQVELIPGSKQRFLIIARRNG